MCHPPRPQWLCWRGWADNAETKGACGVVCGSEESCAFSAEGESSGPILDSVGSQDDAGREGALIMLRSQPWPWRKTPGSVFVGDLRGRLPITGISPRIPWSMLSAKVILFDCKAGRKYVRLRAAILVVTHWPWEMSTLSLGTFMHTHIYLGENDQTEVIKYLCLRNLHRCPRKVCALHLHCKAEVISGGKKETMTQ